MPTYKYTATQADGSPAQGALSAKNPEDARRQLEAMAFSGIALTKQPLLSFKTAPIPPLELSLFCRQMELMLGMGWPFSDALSTISGQSQNKDLQGALASAARQMDAGRPFAEALAASGGALPGYLVSMAAIGEASGTLEEVFGLLAEYYEKEHSIRKKVRSAVLYPCILAGLMLGLVVLLITQILPMFESMLISMGGHLSGAARAMLGAGQWISLYWPFCAALLGLIAAIVRLYGRTPGGLRLISMLRLTLPVSKGISARVVTIRFARGLSLLLKSGVPLFAALDMLAPLMDNPYLSGRFEKSRRDILSGQDLSGALAPMGIFPPLFLRMLSMGEKTGGLDTLLARAAAFLDEELDNALGRLSAALEPALAVVLAGLIGFILLSLMLPMIEILGSIG